MRILKDRIEFDTVEEAQEALFEFKEIRERVIYTSRWSITYETILEHEGAFYLAKFSRGATEQQDESPFEYDKLPIVFKRVYPREKTVIEYK